MLTLLCCCTGVWATPLTGSGTKAEPYLISSADDWNDAATEIYDLSGRRLPQGRKPACGLYIFKKGNTTTKKYVK